MGDIKRTILPMHRIYWFIEWDICALCGCAAGQHYGVLGRGPRRICVQRSDVPTIDASGALSTYPDYKPYYSAETAHG